MTTVSPTPDRDYPQLLGERGLIEPAPRRVRGYFDQALVFDSTRAHYVWEIAYYPQYYIPMSDVRMEHLHDENHVQKLQFGSSRLYSLTSAERTWPSAARVYDSGPVAGSVRYEWDLLSPVLTGPVGQTVFLVLIVDRRNEAWVWLEVHGRLRLSRMGHGIAAPGRVLARSGGRYLPATAGRRPCRWVHPIR